MIYQAAIRYLVALTTLVVLATGARARADEVTIGYQQIYNPWKIVIADRVLEERTGYAVNWRAFDSGARVMEAMAEGDVDIAMAGSSPIAAGVSRGLNIELFWIVEDIGAGEALVARNGSGITAPQDLRGKRIAVPFVSTSHYQLLFALEQFAIAPVQVELLDMPPSAISSAWQRGTIDAAFIWQPALGAIKQTGTVLITSGLLSRWGRATFDGMVADRSWAAEHADFMVAFVKAVAEADEAYRSNREAWTADSEPVLKIARVVGGDPKDIPEVLAQYEFPTLEEQLSERWLGGGAESGAATALYHTAKFLKSQGRIDAVLADYGTAVTTRWVEEALEQAIPK